MWKLLLYNYIAAQYAYSDQRLSVLISWNWGNFFKVGANVHSDERIGIWWWNIAVSSQNRFLAIIQEFTYFWFFFFCNLHCPPINCGCIHFCCFVKDFSAVYLSFLALMSMFEALSPVMDVALCSTRISFIKILDILIESYIYELLQTCMYKL